MSIQSYEFGEQSTINQSGISNGAARARRKRNSQSGSPYNAKSTVNPRQAWLNSMNQGQGFSNTVGSYSKLDNYNSPSAKPLPKTKSVNPASHLDKEEMYDEIQQLKNSVAAFTKERGLLNTKIIKLEKELNKKDKMLDDTYSQSQSVYGGLTERSTRSVETSASVTSLKQKCHKYECIIRDKDNELKTLRSNIKSTRLQELEIMTETYYEEINRLTSVIEQKQFDLNLSFTPRASTPLLSNEKEKLLEAKVKQLEVDNSTLKKEMFKTSNKTLGDTGVLSEYASVSRCDLETQHQAKCKEAFDANLTNDVLNTKCSVLEEELKQLKSGNLKQEENTAHLRENREKLQSKLSTFEGENHAQKLVIKRLNRTVAGHEDETENLRKQIDKDRVQYKDKLKLKTDKINELADKISELKEELEKYERSITTTIRGQDNAAHTHIIPKVEAAQVTEVKKSAPKTDLVSEVTPHVEEEEKKPVTRTPKRKNMRDMEKEKEREKKREERQQRLLEDKAARTIQRNFRNYNLVKSVCLIQQLLRGHSARALRTKKEQDQGAQIIQTALKSYQYKQKHINLLNPESVGEKDARDIRVVDDTALNAHTPRSFSTRDYSTSNRDKDSPAAQRGQKLGSENRSRYVGKSKPRTDGLTRDAEKESIKKAAAKKPETKASREPAVSKFLQLEGESSDEDDLIMM